MDVERETWRRLQLRPVFIACPSCHKVIRRETETAESPTAVVRQAKEPCPACQRWSDGRRS